MAAAFDVSEALNAAQRLRRAADRADETLDLTFRRWVDRTADAMRDEVPKDSWDTHDSIEVQHGDDLTATIGPTNRDEAGRPVGFFINYGTAAQPPDDFIGRTARRASRLADDFAVEDVL